MLERVSVPQDGRTQDRWHHATQSPAVRVVEPRRCEVEGRGRSLRGRSLHLGEDLAPALETESSRLLMHQRVDALLPIRRGAFCCMFQRCADPELSQ